ncbi:MAG: hypothetical protein C0507_23130 [Cyanobacteria bacterium PR.3.49]|nr:hypothetical protein [Cyanobacteria bacterium PR.3.49]
MRAVRLKAQAKTNNMEGSVPPARLKFFFGLCFWASLFWFLLLQSPAQAARKVVFPDTPKPVGTVLTHPLGKNGPLKMLGTTKGTVTVEDGFALYVIATPEGMKYFDSLAKMKPEDIQHLRLHDVTITESNFKTLAKMTGLQNLDLSYSDMDDAKIGKLLTLTNLLELDLSSTLVRGMTLEKLKALKKLDEVDLARTRIHDFAVAKIVQACPNLTRLDIGGTYITDDAILKIKNLRKLTYLKVSKTGISDKYLDELLALKNLKKVQLSSTQVTREKVMSLQAAKPDCKFSLKSDTD